MSMCTKLPRVSQPPGIPLSVRRAALFPSANFPTFPPGYPTRLVRVDGVAVLLSAGMPMALVLPERVADRAVEATLAAVRDLLRVDGTPQGIWLVPEDADPADLTDRLLRAGLTPNDRPPFEPRGAAMAIVEPPPPGPLDVAAHRVRSYDEYIGAQEAAADAFGMDAEMRAAFADRAERLWEFEREGGPSATFVATLGGEVAGLGNAWFGPAAVYLRGSGVRPRYRGRSVYRALVRARWEAAVEAGVPALTVGAGQMSRPALERLGFSIVGWYDCLLDDLTA